MRFKRKLAAEHRHVVVALVSSILRWAAGGAAFFAVSAAAAEPADWKVCSAELSSDAASRLSPERHRECVIAVAGTYLQWVRGDLAAADLPVTSDFVRRSLGTSRSEATTDRTAFLADSRADLIASATEHEWFVDGDTAWAIFTVKLKKTPEDTHWIAERFTVTNGRLSDIMALPPVVKH